MRIRRFEATCPWSMTCEARSTTHYMYLSVSFLTLSVSFTLTMKLFDLLVDDDESVEKKKFSFAPRIAPMPKSSMYRAPPTTTPEASSMMSEPIVSKSKLARIRRRRDKRVLRRVPQQPILDEETALIQQLLEECEEVEEEEPITRRRLLTVSPAVSKVSGGPATRAAERLQDREIRRLQTKRRQRRPQGCDLRAELDVLAAILQREHLLKKGGPLADLRRASVDVVEHAFRWHKTNGVIGFLWHGQNYLCKMASDLLDQPRILEAASALGLQLDGNPMLLPSSTSFNDDPVFADVLPETGPLRERALRADTIVKTEVHLSSSSSLLTAVPAPAPAFLTEARVPSPADLLQCSSSEAVLRARPVLKQQQQRRHNASSSRTRLHLDVRDHVHRIFSSGGSVLDEAVSHRRYEDRRRQDTAATTIQARIRGVRGRRKRRRFRRRPATPAEILKARRTLGLLTIYIRNHLQHRLN